MENEIKKVKEEIQVMSLKRQYIKLYSSLIPSTLYCCMACIIQPLITRKKYIL